ncbi:MAG TPA: lipid A biosynthesis acyltransferase [Myxococcota bacterium]
MSASSLGSEAASPPNRWVRIAERGSLWGLRFTAWLFRSAGRGPTLVLVTAIVSYFFLTDRAGRRASAAYLRRVYATEAGRAALGRAPTTWDSFLHYRAFALSIVDRLSIWFGKTDDFQLEIHGFEPFDRLAEGKRGAIVLGAHLGSFDVMRMLAERHETVVNVLMFTVNAQRINQIFRELSPEVETHVIHVDPGSVEAVFEVRRCLARGEHVAILGDRMEPGDRHRSCRVPLLGGEVELPQAPFLLASLLGCPVLLVVALRRGPQRYQVFTEQLAEKVQLPRLGREEVVRELLTTYAARLEHHCQRAPYEWFNFYDYWGDDPS